MELFLLLVDEVAMFLAWFALFDIVLAVCFYGRPKVSGSKYSSGHGTCTEMVAANAFVLFLNNILCLLCRDTFEEGLVVPAFVKVIAYHGIPGGLSKPSFVRILWGVAGFEVLDIGGGLVMAFGGVDVVIWDVG